MSSHDAPPTHSKMLGRRTSLIAVALAVVIVVIATALFAINQSRSAQAIAERYLAHIAVGEANLAQAMVAPSHPDLESYRDDALLADNVMRMAVEFISDIHVTEHATADTTHASFDVTFTLAGHQYEDRLDLVTDAPGPFTNWQIEAPFSVSFLIEAAGPADIAIAGVPIDRPKLGEVAWITMYPAEYPLEVVGTDLFETATDSIIVGIGNSPGDITLTPTSALHDAVNEQVRAVLDGCATQTTRKPEGCPLEASIEAEGVPVEWTITTHPTPVISEDGTTFSFDDGLVRAVYTPIGATGTVEEESALWLSGTIVVNSNSVRIRFAE